MKKKELYQMYQDCLAQSYISVENDGDYAIKKCGDTLKIYFEWSNGETDWKNNFAFAVKPYKDMQIKWRCHRGFLKVWKSIKPYIKEDILNPEVRKIEIVGYSHGAAIAQLCYEYVKFNRPDVEVVGVGFGAPRVFWGFVKKEIKNRFKDFIVVRNGNDIVTHVPPRLFGFRHLGKVLKIGKKIGLVKDHYPERYTAATLELANSEETI